jgi:hypothetical protein
MAGLATVVVVLLVAAFAQVIQVSALGNNGAFQFKLVAIAQVWQSAVTLAAACHRVAVLVASNAQVSVWVARFACRS